MNVFDSRMFLLALCLTGSASLAESWHADPVSGCTVFDDDDAVTNVVISWSGDCDSNSRASGDGVLSWFEDGKLAARFVGRMKAGQADGIGVIFVLGEEGSYDRFEGVFKDNNLAGNVKATGWDGGTFEGTMDSTDLSGEGIFIAASGDQYTGEFLNGKMNGKGHLVLANSEQYRGKFRDNELDGVGEWLGANSDYYKGEFATGEFSGEGRYEAFDGAAYEGEFLAGLPEGEGRYTDAAGRITAGIFKAGWPDGQVDITTVDGETLSEFWTDGEKEEF